LDKPKPGIFLDQPFLKEFKGQYARKKLADNELRNIVRKPDLFRKADILQPDDGSSFGVSDNLFGRLFVVVQQEYIGLRAFMENRPDCTGGECPYPHVTCGETRAK